MIRPTNRSLPFDFGPLLGPLAESADPPSNPPPPDDPFGPREPIRALDPKDRFPIEFKEPIKIRPNIEDLIRQRPIYYAQENVIIPDFCVFTIRICCPPNICSGALFTPYTINPDGSRTMYETIQMDPPFGSVGQTHCKSITLPVPGGSAAALSGVIITFGIKDLTFDMPINAQRELVDSEVGLIGLCSIQRIPPCSIAIELSFYSGIP